MFKFKGNKFFAALFSVYFVFSIFSLINFVVQLGFFELFGRGIWGLLLMFLTGLQIYGFWTLKDWTKKVTLFLFLIHTVRFTFASLINFQEYGRLDAILFVSIFLIVPYAASLLYLHKHKSLFKN